MVQIVLNLQSERNRLSGAARLFSVHLFVMSLKGLLCLNRMSVTYDFFGRNVLVTGGAKGVGKATVEKFLEAGANKVFVVDKDRDAIAQLTKQHPNVSAVAVDLSNWAETKAAVEIFGPIHHLVNNAGIGGKPTSFLELQPTQVDQIFDVNLKAIINVSQVMAKSVKLNHLEDATIVNISSVMSKLPYKGVALYCSTKAAVSMLTRSMALELEPLKIRVNTLSPTIMETDLTRNPASFDMDAAAAAKHGSAPPATGDHQGKMTNFMKYLVGRHIIKRMATTQECADVILYLSSKSTSIFTGEELFIDGGLLAN